jgi:uncharacterized protein YjbI with pentapeptide repeats
MKRKTLIISFAATLGMTAAVVYFSGLTKPVPVKQLLETRQCQGCDLRGANLRKLNLEGVNLEGANLEGANLEKTKLGNANLQRANLTQANLNRADFGCTRVSLKLRADEKNANIGFDLSTIPEIVHSKNTKVNFDLKANESGATLNFNLKGCTNLADAELKGAKMPDGTIHP